MKLLAVVCLLLAFVRVSAPSSWATDDPFVGPSNWGWTGLMETPTARLLKSDTLRVGAGQEFPYRYYYGTLGLFENLELNGRVTEILGVPGFSNQEGSSYGDYKDKAIDLKYRLWAERKWAPALSLGIMDPYGTRIYPGQYLVASKQIYPFDFTLGFGNGRFGKRPLPSSGEGFRAEMLTDPGEWARDGQPFWGIEFSPSPYWSLMVERSPVKYDKQTNDPAQPRYFTRPVDFPYNFGFRFRPLTWTEIDLTYQRGHELGLNVSVLFDVGRPLVPIYDKPYKEKAEDRTLPPGEKIVKALKEQGFSDIGVEEAGETLTVRAQNDKYFYSMKALGVIMRTVTPLLAPSIEKVCITLTQTDLPILEIATTPEDIRDLYAGRLTGSEFFRLAHVDPDVQQAPRLPLEEKKLLIPGWKPSFETLLDDPSGFFKYRLGAEGWLTYQPWKGVSMVAGVETYPLNNISSSNIPPSEAVRSDIFAYEQSNIGLDRLMLDQVCKPSGNVWTRFAAGLLEIEYAGLDAEVAMPSANGRFLVGLEGSIVKKRDPDSLFAFKTYNVKKYYDVEFFNARVNLPEKEMALDFKTGRFLGTDFGTRVTLIKYIRGVTLFAWYSFTDTAVFKDPSNRGYHDKGIGVAIPIRLFEGTDSTSSYNYALSPWTRDVAQDIDRFQNLFDLIGRDQKVFLQNETGMLVR